MTCWAARVGALIGLAALLAWGAIDHAGRPDPPATFEECAARNVACF